MKILVLGGAGMLGHKIFKALVKRKTDVYCTIKGAISEPYLQNVAFLHSNNVIEGVDAMNFEALRLTIAEVHPDFVVNCIGIIKQRDSASSPIPSISINSLLPHLLAEWVSAWGGRVIHFSTDCVFSGDRGAYTEEDLSDARDLYGKSKFLGEVQAANALTLRTSIVGRELTHFQSLLEWLLRQNGKKINGYTKAIYSGVTTNHLADVVSWLIESHPTLNGLYQVASTPIEKYQLISLFKAAFNVDVEISPVDGEICDRSMLGHKFEAATGYRCPSWADLVKELASDATIYESYRQTAVSTQTRKIGLVS